MRYGITPEQFLAMEASQKGRCAICRKAKKLHVDHCHETKQVRGLLCMACNTSLGKFENSPEMLRAAIQYLEGVT
jgi:hypothetical protein